MTAHAPGSAAEMAREAYLASPLGKARKAIAKAERLSGEVTVALARMSCALTRGDGTDAARRQLFDAVLALRIACGDVEALTAIAQSEAA